MFFELLKEDDQVVVLEILFEGDLDKISHPYFLGLEKYIKITKGEHQEIHTYSEDKQLLSVIDIEKNYKKNIQEDRIKQYIDILLNYLAVQGIEMNPKRKINVFKIVYNDEFLDELFIEVDGKRIATCSSLDEIKRNFGEYEVIREGYDCYRQLIELEVKVKD